MEFLLLFHKILLMIGRQIGIFRQKKKIKEKIKKTKKKKKIVEIKF